MQYVQLMFKVLYCHSSCCKCQDAWALTGYSLDTSMAMKNSEYGGLASITTGYSSFSLTLVAQSGDGLPLSG